MNRVAISKTNVLMRFFFLFQNWVSVQVKSANSFTVIMHSAVSKRCTFILRMSDTSKNS